MRILTSLALALSLTACATCDRNPYACAAGVAIVAGSLAASVQHHHDQTHLAPKATALPVNCTGGMCQ